jgi:preprotein translocase subunit SecF
MSLQLQRIFIMNSKFIASALIAAAGFTSVGAFAAGADGAVDIQPTLTSNVSRADVRAQARSAAPAAVTASNLVDGGTVIVATPAASERSRADVRAEAVQDSKRFNAAPGRA